MKAYPKDRVFIPAKIYKFRTYPNDDRWVDVFVKDKYNRIYTIGTFVREDLPSKISSRGFITKNAKAGTASWYQCKYVKKLKMNGLI